MSKHDEAIAAFHQGRSADALRLLQPLLEAGETSELWNDWAAVQLTLGDIERSEAGFSRALELDPDNTDATINLGVLLLSRGDTTRALPLLTSVLPLLPASHRQTVNALLARNGGPSSKPESTISDERHPRILVISDTFPHPAGGGRDRQLLEVLRAFRELGAELTFAAREGVNSEECEPLLRQSGIHTHSNDAEYMASLGSDVQASYWSLHGVLARAQFDIAILIQNFDRGISVPEQYLEELRQQAPATRIAVFVPELYVASGGVGENPLVDFEVAENWSARQWEAFERADVVLVPTEDDAALLRKCGRSLHVEVTHYLKTINLAATTKRILALAPTTYVGETFSVRLVDTLFREHLSGKAGPDRLLGELECHARLAEQLLHEQNPTKAREQLRHIFGRSTHSMRAGYFAAQILIILKRCYRQLGNVEMADRCAAEARSRAVIKTAQGLTLKLRRADDLRFSVIVPTYNRLPILMKCLAAMEAQTLASNDFEVIVIDDGSSDGTQEALKNYHPPFRFQYLRQTNSGTGAARRNGVAHASGEYLLLMNDDTICDRDLLEQHLRTQTKYASGRWAVLGNFQYPVEARRRALSQYFCVEPFMFPQVSMEAGCPYGYSHFITCNLSIRRDAVVEAGSFDPTYKLSEDTELGIRLHEMGYRVLYHPEAHAFHDHLPYPARNLIRRARVYGADYFYMFGRHPRVMKEWAMPVNLTGMDEQNAMRIALYVEAHRQEVEEAVEALERWDSVDFDALLAGHADTAAMVLNLFRQAVPAIHWFYLFESMLHTMIRELGLRHLASEPPPMRAAHAAGATS
jgi:GT2 family glycosyltransferase/tetratricopeptide (TPR) repeat protein